MILIFDVYGVAYVGAKLNTPLLEAIQRHRENGVKVFFASNMAASQKALFWDVLGLSAFGEEIFCSGDLNVAKPEPAFYSRVAAAIGARPDSDAGDSILFFDDSIANVEAAKACGWQAFLYTDVNAALTEIETYHGL